MKKMITAVAALLMSAATFAQASNDSPPPAQGARMQQGQRKPMDPAQAGKRETERINSLTPLGSAYDKVLAVNTDYATKRSALRGAGGPPTDEQKAQMKELNNTHKKDLQAAMGPDLFAKYEAAIKAKREERKEMAPQGGAPNDK